MNDISSFQNPHTVIESALQALEISVEHSRECLEETQYWLNNTGLDDEALEDWTALPFVTIDNPDSRDLDQALLIETRCNLLHARVRSADAPC